MPTTPDLTAILRGRRSRPVAAATRADLEKRRAAYQSARPQPIGHLSISVDGTTYDGMYEALLEPAASFDRAELSLTGPSPTGPTSEFVRPFRRIVFHPDGSADLIPGSGSPERAIARLLLREGFGGPLSGPSFGAGRLPTLGQFAEAIRAGGFVPFALALELYCSNERLRYEVDVGGTDLLPDPRAGRLRRAPGVGGPRARRGTSTGC